MTVTAAVEALAWSQSPEPELVPYPDNDNDECGAWTAAWAYAAWLALSGLVVAAIITGALILAHSDTRPEPTVMADGGAAAMDAPIAMPALPTIPDGPDSQRENSSPDTAFLSALHTGAPGWVDTDSRYILWGRWVCQSVASGRSLPDTITMLSSTPPIWTMPATQYFVRTAMKAYCPGSVG